MFLIKSNTICALLDALSRVSIAQRSHGQTTHLLEKFAWDLMELLLEFQRAPGYHHIREATWLKHLYCFVAMYKVDRDLPDLVGVTTELLMAYSEMLSAADIDNVSHRPIHLLELDALLVESDKFPRLPAPEGKPWEFQLTRETMNHVRTWEEASRPRGILGQDWLATSTFGRDIDVSALYPELIVSSEGGWGYYHTIGIVNHILNDSPIRRSVLRDF